MTVKLDSLTAQFTDGFNINGVKNVAGLANGLGGQNQQRVQLTYGTQALNSAVLGCDEAMLQVFTIAASGTLDIDLSAFTDLGGQTATLVGGRVKAFRFHLLAAAQMAPDNSTAGTACSSVSIGNATSNGNKLTLDAQASTYTIPNGGIWSHKDYTAAGIVVDAAHKILHVVNNDAVNSAKLLVALAGATS